MRCQAVIHRAQADSAAGVDVGVVGEDVPGRAEHCLLCGESAGAAVHQDV
jgi:hypothetical protein